MEENINKQTNILLPPELIREIIKLSPIGILLKIKSTCKLFCNLITEEIESRRLELKEKLNKLEGSAYIEYAKQWMCSFEIEYPSYEYHGNRSKLSSCGIHTSMILYYLNKNNWEKIYYIISHVNNLDFKKVIQYMFKGDKKTLFHLACENGYIFLVKRWYNRIRKIANIENNEATSKILVKIVNKDSYNCRGISPLLCAFKNNKKDVVLFLANIGFVKKFEYDLQNKDILDYALRNKNEYIINKFINLHLFDSIYLKCCKYGYKGKLESYNNKLYNTLEKSDIEQGIYYAIRYGHKQVLRYLKKLFDLNLSKSITYKLDTNVSKQPIYIAFLYNQESVANFLLDCNVNYEIEKLLKFIGNLEYKVDESIIERIANKNLNDDDDYYYDNDYYYDDEYYHDDEYYGPELAY